jgi:hypothetical protein
MNGRAGWASLLVGLAVANKPWALVAVPVVIAALPAARRRALALTAVSAGVVLLPILVVRDHSLSAGANGVQIGSTVFNPPQLLWWLGPHSWIAREARPGIVLLAIACAALWWVRRARSGALGPATSDALLLLALVLLLRAALDPWNNLYYHVPFLFALMAYEAREGRAPLLTLAYTVVLLIVVPIGGVPHMSPDLRAAVYAAVVLPTIAWLGVRLYGPGAASPRLLARRQPQPATLSADTASAG